MAAYNDLTADQKADVQNLLNFMRGCSGDLAKLLNKAKAISSGYVGNIETLLATISSGSELIPDTSNLAGAEDMTKDEILNLVGYFITLSNTADNSAGSYNTNYHRALYAKACGPQNLA